MCIYQGGQLVTGANGVKSLGYSLYSLGKVSSCQPHKDVTGRHHFRIVTVWMFILRIVLWGVNVKTGGSKSVDFCRLTTKKNK